MRRHQLAALVAAAAVTLGAASCGSDDGADVRNIGGEDGSGSGVDSSGSSSATEAGE